MSLVIIHRSAYIEISFFSDDVKVELEATGVEVLLLALDGPGPEPGHGAGDHLERRHLEPPHLADAEVGAQAPGTIKLVDSAGHLGLKQLTVNKGRDYV